MTRFLLAVCAVLALALAVQTVRVERLKPQLHDARQALKDWSDYRKTAEADAQTAADQCAARVNAARRSAQRISNLLETPYEVDPVGCPVRQLLPADGLRDALTPPPSPSAEPLHDR